MHDKGVPEIHNGKRLRFIPSEPDTVSTDAGIVNRYPIHYVYADSRMP